jgi:tetratricopeptide (TPR) repeat protein
MEHDKAIADLSAAIRIEPRFAPVYYARCLASTYKGDRGSAIADFAEAIRLAPKDRDTHLAHGFAWSSKRDFDRAIADYDKAIRLDPSLVRAYRDPGLVPRPRKPDYDAAIANFDEIIRLDPANTVGHLGRGILRSELKEFDDAIADFDAAVRINPASAPALVCRGIAWTRLKEYDKALADFVRALTLGPKDASAHDGLAWLFATCPDARYRNGVKAVAHATRACELAEWTDTVLLATLAASHAEAGNFAKAVECQQKALALTRDETRIEDDRLRLSLYRDKQPYRDK